MKQTLEASSRAELSPTAGWILIAAVFAALALSVSGPEVDPDLPWHLATGRLIAESGSVPQQDPFSFTSGEKQWVNHEWLTDWLMWTIHRTAGVRSLFAVAAVTFTAAFALVLASTVGRGVSPLLALAVAVPGFTMAMPVHGPRPQVITLLFLALWMLLLDRFRSGRLRVHPALMLPPVILIWSNLHGGFAIGIGLLGLVAIGTAVDAWRDRTGFGVARALAFAIPLCLIAAAVHPAGIRQLLYPLEFLRPNPWTAIIREWQAPDYAMSSFLLFRIVLVATLVVLWLSRERASIADVLVLAAVTYLAIGSARNVALWGVIAVPVVASVVARLEWMKGLGASHSRWRPAAAAAVAGVIAAAFAMPILTITPDAVDAAWRRSGPAAALRQLGNLEREVNLFTLYGWGGHAIWSSGGRARVFVDGRADTIYPDDVLHDYYAVTGFEPQWRAILERRGVNAILMPSDSLLLTVLRREGWKEIHSDREATILLR